MEDSPVIHATDTGDSENMGTLFGGPYNKDPTILGYYIRVPYFRKLPHR